ncbi:hypothetical protein Syun_019336 [Stephania yunnanensis]|uniref:NAB domain-containing protein n=1 Tax=Stephania yunnanensis TaxID=152371 RepID=A0AAP0NX96_9MAGN
MLAQIGFGGRLKYRAEAKMAKHRWRESIKSFFEHHFAHEKSQELENTKNGIENKVAKMLRLIEEEENEETGPPGSFKKHSELVDLIEDVHEQYQSLYSLYSHLVDQLRDKVHSREKTNGHSSSSSSSDSDSDHSSNKANKNKKQNSEHPKLELEALDQKFRAAEKDNETLSSEHFLALSKIEQAEKKIDELQTKAEQLEGERLRLWVENGKMTLELEAARNLEAELKQRLNDADVENETLKGEKLVHLSRIEEQTKVIEALKAEADLLKEEKSTLWVENGATKLEMESLKQLVLDLNQQLNSAFQEKDNASSSKIALLSAEIDQTQKTILELTNEIKQLKDLLEVREAELSKLHSERQESEHVSSARINVLESELTELKLEIDSFMNQKRGYEDQMESRSNEAKLLGKENLRLKQVESELLQHISESEKMSKERIDELSGLLQKVEGDRDAALVQLRIMTDKSNEQQMELEALQAQKAELEGRIDCKLNEAKQMGEENLKLQQAFDDAQAMVAKLERMASEREEELSVIHKSHEESKNQASSQIENLSTQVNNHQRELDTLGNLKRDSDFELERLKEEAARYQMQMEVLNRDLENKTADQQTLLKELERLMVEVNALQQEVSSLHAEASQLKGENMQLLQDKMKNQEEILDLEGQLKVRVDELCSLQGKLDDSENEALTQIKDLNLKVNDLQQELDLLRARKNELEEQIASKDNDIKQLREETLELKLAVTGLQDKILKLESTIKHSTDEVSSLLERLRDSENHSSSKIEDLTTQVTSVQLELDSVVAQRNQLEQEIGRRNQEITDHLVQLESLNSELDSLRAEKNRLEEEKMIEFLKREKLLEENSGLEQTVTELQDKILNLETLSKMKEDENLSTLKKLEDTENGASIQIKQLTDDAQNQQLELEALRNLKCELELQNEQIAENLTRVENVNLEMTSKIEARETMLKEQQDTFCKLNEEYKQLEERFEKSKEDLHAAEQMIREREEQLQLELKSKDEQILRFQEESALLRKEIDTIQGEVGKLRMKSNEHEEKQRELGDELQRVEQERARINEEKNDLLQSKDKTIERMEATLGEAQEEIRRLHEEVSSVEVKLRLANRKLQITEQLLIEKEESHKQIEERFVLENKSLKEQIGGLSEQVTFAKGTMVTTENALAELELVFQKHDQDQVSFSKRILHLSEDLQVARKWVSGMKIERRELKKEMSHLVEELGEYKELISAQMKKIEKLEKMMSESRVEKEGLLIIISGLEKRTTELERKTKEIELAVVDREEEKREAIRQLCLWIDYHRENFDYVKELLSKTLKSNQRRRVDATQLPLVNNTEFKA